VLPTICECVFGRNCTLHRERTILAAEETYNRAVAQVRAENPDSWETVPPYVSTDKNEQTCACGKSFALVYALKNHIAEGWVGSSHDRLPECRPRLGIAYIISDASCTNSYQLVLAAHAMRVVSRSSDDEPSTSVQEQCVTAAMGSLNRIAPDKCKALLSSDSLSGLMALKKVCMLLAGAAAQQGRSHEMDFYSGLRPQEGATNFWTSAGVPMFGDPFEQVGLLAQQVRVTRCLNKESCQPDCNRSKATRVMRLMEKGEVDGKHWAQMRKQLHGNLKAEAMWSFLGQLASSSLNLCTLMDCADAQGIRNIFKLGEKGRPCHFSQGGPDSRVHWCHKSPAWQPA